MHSYWTIVAFIVAFSSCAALAANLRPVIGIMTQPTAEESRSGHDNQYIAASYVKVLLLVILTTDRRSLSHFFNVNFIS